MPRTGPTHDPVVTDAEAFAEEVELSEVTISALAARLGVRQPSLYRHIDGIYALHSKRLYPRPKRADRRSRSSGHRPISRRQHSAPPPQRYTAS